MKNFFTKEVLTHPLVALAGAAVAVIAVASGVYYYHASQTPEVEPLAETGAADVRASGTVEPAQNPNVAFVSGGRVAGVFATVGSDVVRGTILARLDTARLAASRAQAAAQVKAAEATLSQMQAPVRAVDIAGKQTALDAARQKLADDQVSGLNTLTSAYTQSYGSLHTETDTLFTNPDTPEMAVVFQTKNSQTLNALLSARIHATAALRDLKADAAALEAGGADATAQALTGAAASLFAVRSYSMALAEALSGALPSSTFSTADIASANASNAVLRDTTNALISSITAAKQTITTDQIQITAAENALSQAAAGSTPEQIAAQEAAVEAAQAALAVADAALADAIVVAPFNGTVASVQVKVGDIVAPNTTAVALTPHSALEVTAYLSALDAARIAPGDTAAVALDAYGSNRIFPATVATVDRAPTMQSGIPAYRVVVEFNQDDPAIETGMTAEITITPQTN